MSFGGSNQPWQRNQQGTTNQSWNQQWSESQSWQRNSSFPNSNNVSSNTIPNNTAQHCSDSGKMELTSATHQQNYNSTQYGNKNQFWEGNSTFLGENNTPVNFAYNAKSGRVGYPPQNNYSAGMRNQSWQRNPLFSNAYNMLDNNAMFANNGPQSNFNSGGAKFETAAHAQIYNSTGTITKINNECGVVNDEVFFFLRVCQGPVPKLGDQVSFEAKIAASGHFKWDADHVQLISPPYLSGQSSRFDGSDVRMPDHRALQGEKERDGTLPKRQLKAAHRKASSQAELKQQNSCTDCGETFKTTQKYEKHKRKLPNGFCVTAKRIEYRKCGACFTLLANKFGLARHMFKNHRRIFPFVCDNCQSKFKYFEELEKHIIGKVSKKATCYSEKNLSEFEVYRNTFTAKENAKQKQLMIHRAEVKQAKKAAKANSNDFILDKGEFDEDGEGAEHDDECGEEGVKDD